MGKALLRGIPLVLLLLLAPGVWSLTRLLNTDPLVYDVALGDLDGDGDLDAVLDEVHQVSVFLTPDNK